MNAIQRVLSWFWILCILHFCHPLSQQEQKRIDNNNNDDNLPNIVIMFADNLGYDDVSFTRYYRPDKQSAINFSKPTTQSSTTPNIDRLATEGMTFSHWNSAASLCSASRATLLTGKYAVKTGVYPHVFEPDSVYGLSPSEETIADVLQKHNYATTIVGKWHLGHSSNEYLPTSRGFDSFFGIPYHISGGSLDDNICNKDILQTQWLPLYNNTTIVQQPVQLDKLAQHYASSASDFIYSMYNSSTKERIRPFFLYMAFSHVHQLCAPRDALVSQTCQWSNTKNSTFDSAVMEMDWIAGQILNAIDYVGAANNTLVLFTSDNGPWTAEQSCSGSKGPFKGQWLSDNSKDSTCVACPHDYQPSPSEGHPLRCVLPGTTFELDGVRCGDDTGLGSVWEANLRMPAIAKFPNKIRANSHSNETVSTLDVMPTIMSIIGAKEKYDIINDLDGIDISDILFENKKPTDEPRMLFFWRDGFNDGPLGPPFGRMDVAAVKYGYIKAWFWTKSAHYNDDLEEFHDPPLLFDIDNDPAESAPLDPKMYQSIINKIINATKKHKEEIGWTMPLTLARDPKFIPCVDHNTGCRTNGYKITENDSLLEST